MWVESIVDKCVRKVCVCVCVHIRIRTCMYTYVRMECVVEAQPRTCVHKLAIDTSMCIQCILGYPNLDYLTP